MNLLAALISGLLFGFGLSLSGMVNPHTVLAFLNLSPEWNPSLAWVMVGALTVAFVGYRVVGRRAAPLFVPRFLTPDRTSLDLPLFGGSVLFGIGWGLGGFCPGPALVSGFIANDIALVFLAAYVVGTLLHGRLAPLLQRPASQGNELPPTVVSRTDG